MPYPAWQCPVPNCSSGPGGAAWAVTETAADVAALAEAHARDRLGELPEAAALGELRAERVERALADHLAEHSVADLLAYACKILFTPSSQVTASS